MKEILYVTGNNFKLLAAEKFLKPLGVQVKQIKMDVPEIQTNNCEECAIFSSKYASEKLQTSCLKNDSGLFIEALNGFPGVYTAFIERALTEKQILRIMEDVENRKAYIIEVLAYTEFGGETKTFTSITHGTISTELSGDYGWGYDLYFIPDGQTKTLGNFPDDERIKLWDNTAYVEMAEYFKQKEN